MSLSQIEQMLDRVRTLARGDRRPGRRTRPARRAAGRARLPRLSWPRCSTGRSGPVAPPVPMTPRKRALAGVLVLALSGVGATGLSAAANTLPRPLQHQVSEFSRHYLPFDLPEPPIGRPVRRPCPSHALPHQAPAQRDADDTGGASRSDGPLGCRGARCRRAPDRGPAERADHGCPAEHRPVALGEPLAQPDVQTRLRVTVAEQHSLAG